MVAGRFSSPYSITGATVTLTEELDVSDVNVVAVASW